MCSFAWLFYLSVVLMVLSVVMSSSQDVSDQDQSPLKKRQKCQDGYVVMEVGVLCSAALFSG